jgi:preprotein translocase subunit Sss1
MSSIFNLPDLVIDLSLLGQVGYLLYLLGRRIVRSARKPKNLEPA